MTRSPSSRLPRLEWGNRPPPASSSVFLSPSRHVWAFDEFDSVAVAEAAGSREDSVEKHGAPVQFDVVPTDDRGHYVVSALLGINPHTLTSRLRALVLKKGYDVQRVAT